MAGMAAAGAVAAALLARERTGEGQLVSTSLLRIGMYMLGWDISMSAATRHPGHPHDRATAAEPADQRVHGRRRTPVLVARSTGRPPLAGSAAGGRPARLGGRPRDSIRSSTAGSTRPSSSTSSTSIFATKSLGGVGRGVRSRRRLVGAGAARARDDRRSRGARGRRFRRRPERRRRSCPDGRHARRLRGDALVAAVDRAGVRRSTPRRCCSSSATTGTASSS